MTSSPAEPAEVLAQPAHDPVHRAEVRVHPADAELAAAALLVTGALGLWDRGAGELTAWFPAPVDLAALPGLADAVVTWHLEPPRDWQAAWKATVAPVRAGSTVVVPSWLVDTHTPEPGELTLVLDPGQAFGTGHHATTTLCLEALERLDLAGASVADVGCGTGVLAIAAARRGAGQVVAVDVDPDAVEVTRDNVARNHADVTARTGSVDALAGPVDVVVANLVTDTLVALAPALVAAARRTLVVSGIDAQRQQVVVAALTAAGARVIAAEERDGWAALTAVPAASPRARGGRRRIAAVLGALGMVVLLGACAEPELADEEEETEEVAGSAPSAPPAPEIALLREQFGVLEASVARARDLLREAAEASDLATAQTAGEEAIAQLVADGTLAGDSPGDSEPPAVLPAESVVRGDQRTYPDALTPTLSAARQAGGALGDQVVGVLRDPLAGDLATWERDPAGMIAQAEAVADADRALEGLDEAVLDLDGDALRALAWALLVTEADDLELASAYGERGAVHLDLILEAMAQVIEPEQPDADAAIDAEESP